MKLSILKDIDEWTVIRKVKYISLILLVPFILLLVIKLLTWIGTIFGDITNIYMLKILMNEPIKLGDFIYYYLVILGLEVTSLFSYSILWASDRANELSSDAFQEIQRAENIKSQKEKNLAAVELYHDLRNISISTYGVAMLWVKLHIDGLIEVDTFQYPHFSYSENFRRHIALLNGELLEHNKIYMSKKSNQENMTSSVVYDLFWLYSQSERFNVKFNT